MCACCGGRGVCEALGVGGGGTGKEGHGVGLGERVRVASPRAVGRPSARPLPRVPSPPAAPSPERPSSRRAAAVASPDPARREGTREGPGFQDRAGRPAAGNVSSAFFLLPAPGAAATKKRS